jgi:hypothetical protein
VGETGGATKNDKEDEVNQELWNNFETWHKDVQKATHTSGGHIRDIIPYETLLFTECLMDLARSLKNIEEKIKEKK